MKKVAIKREQAFTPEGFPLIDNFHFSIMPREVTHEAEVWFYKRIGYEIVEVEDEVYKSLCKGFGQMIQFQLNVNMLWNKEVTPSKKDKLDG